MLIVYFQNDYLKMMFIMKLKHSRCVTDRQTCNLTLLVANNRNILKILIITYQDLTYFILTNHRQYPLN